MQKLKSFLYRVNLRSREQKIFAILIVFALLSLFISCFLEFFFPYLGCSFSIFHRYLLILISLNGLLGVFRPFKTSYIKTCQILLITLLITTLIQAVLPLNFIENIFSLKVGTVKHSLLSPALLTNSFLTLSSLGSIFILVLFLRKLDPKIQKASSYVIR